MIDDNLYTTGGVAKKLGIKYITLRDWLRMGYIEPSVEKSTGQGSPNIFNHKDVYKVAVFRRLVSLGFSRELASELAKVVEDMKSTQVDHVYPMLVFIIKPKGVSIKAIARSGELSYFVTTKLPEDFDSIVILNTRKMWEEILRGGQE